MKLVKSLILGSAAGLIAMGGAQAADLPVKAKAVEYVRICSLYGAGFWYIPGTDTCIKLGGYLRIDTTFNGGHYDQPAYSGDAGQRNRYFDYFASRSRMALTVDTRTATEYGVVRTFGQADFQFSTLGGGSYNPNTINMNAPIGSSNLLDTPGGGYVAGVVGAVDFMPGGRNLPQTPGLVDADVADDVGSMRGGIGLSNTAGRGERHTQVGHRGAVNRSVSSRRDGGRHAVAELGGVLDVVHAGNGVMTADQERGVVARIAIPRGRERRDDLPR